jgi:hypothetical protein
MKRLVFLMIVAASPAVAHPGHIADVAGHAHWIGLGAVIGAAILAGLLGAKGRKDDEATDENETDGEEVPA